MVTLRNAIIANNELVSCGGGTVGFLYEGLSISSDNSCGTPVLHMLVADPLLGTLADNGGPTQTRALDRNSPAINATDCDVTVDQRYVPRDAKCDIGPFEFVFTSVALTINPTVRVDPQTGAATVTGTLQCTRGEQFNLSIDLTQDEKTHRTPIVVDARQSIPVTCGTTAQPWIALITPPSGEAFENGDAVAAAQTVDIAKGVTPSTVSAAVKLAWAKK